MSNEIQFKPPGPVAKAFMESRKEVRVLLGPVGSAKSSTTVITILAHAATQPKGADGIRRSRWGVVRNSYRDLKGATLKTWHDWIPRAYGQVTMGSPIVHHVREGDIDCEVLFFPLDSEEDAERLRSFEFTGIWFDEVSEIPWPIIQAALSRVGRYPSVRLGGCSWSGLLLTSNMVDPDHWLAKKCFVPPETWSIHIQPGGLDPNAENIENLKPNYYQSLVATNDEDWCRRFVHAQFVPVQVGKVVYPGFRDSVHVAKESVAPSPDLGVVLGLDFGLTPACAFVQQRPDGTVLVFDELTSEDTGLQRFAQHLSTYWQQKYSHLRVVGAYGDPAGTARSTDTERTAFDVFNAHTPWKWRPARTNEISQRTEAVAFFLNKLIDGRPGFVLNPGCTVLRSGFNGKYAYQPIRSGSGLSFHDTPSKGPASHIQDALQYAVLGLGGADLVIGRERRQGNRSTMAQNIDYPIFGDNVESPRGVGVVVGNARPAHLDSPSRSREVRGSDYDIFNN